MGKTHHHSSQEQCPAEGRPSSAEAEKEPGQQVGRYLNGRRRKAVKVGAAMKVGRVEGQGEVADGHNSPRQRRRGGLVRDGGMKGEKLRDRGM